MNLRSLIGRPWAVPCDPPNSFDCWELVRYVRGLSGLHTPSVVDIERRVPTDRKHFQTPPTGWKRMSESSGGCVVRIGLNHVGVFIGGDDVLHAQLSAGVRIDHLWALPETTFWELETCQ